MTKFEGGDECGGGGCPFRPDWDRYIEGPAGGESVWVIHLGT